MANLVDQDYSEDDQQVQSNYVDDDIQLQDGNIRVINARQFITVCKVEERLDETNYADWSCRLIPLLRVSQVWHYVVRKIPRPCESTDPINARKWDLNDDFAKQLVMQNITNAQLRHIKMTVKLPPKSGRRS